jgi:hypothetical protein
MNRQARTGYTVLVKSREMTEDPNTAVVAWGKRGKDDRKQNKFTTSAEGNSMDKNSSGPKTWVVEKT